MFQVLSLVVLLGLTLCILPSHQAMAQRFNESGVVYEAARNKIGLIRYCRNNQLLDPVVASQALTAVETGLLKVAPADALAREQGDRAQQAGEDGFWEAGRTRDIAGVASLFRTTPADLCREWANETLRAQTQAQGRRRPVTTASMVTSFPSIRPIQPLPQAEPKPAKLIEVQPIQNSLPIIVETAPLERIRVESVPIIVETAPVEPIRADKQAALATIVVKTVRSDPLPPLPVKAPFLPTRAELASLQRTWPAGGDLASTGRTALRGGSDTATAPPRAAPRPLGQALPVSTRLATESGPFLRDQAITAAVPQRADDRPPSLWPFNRLGRTERCLMRGCRWPSAPQEKRSLGY